MFLCVEMFAWCVFLLWRVCASEMCVLVWSVICVEYVCYVVCVQVVVWWYMNPVPKGLGSCCGKALNWNGSCWGVGTTGIPWTASGVVIHCGGSRSRCWYLVTYSYCLQLNIPRSLCGPGEHRWLLIMHHTKQGGSESTLGLESFSSIPGSAANLLCDLEQIAQPFYLTSVFSSIEWGYWIHRVLGRTNWDAGRY